MTKRCIDKIFKYCLIIVFLFVNCCVVACHSIPKTKPLNIHNNEKDYLKAKPMPSLVVPPGMGQLPREDFYRIPQTGNVTDNEVKKLEANRAKDVSILPPSITLHKKQSHLHSNSSVGSDEKEKNNTRKLGNTVSFVAANEPTLILNENIEQAWPHMREILRKAHYQIRGEDEKYYVYEIYNPIDLGRFASHKPPRYRLSLIPQDDKTQVIIRSKHGKMLKVGKANYILGQLQDALQSKSETKKKKFWLWS